MSSDPPSPVVLESPRLLLELPGPSAAGRLLAHYIENRTHLSRWSPPHPPGFYSEEFWRWRLEESRNEYVADQSLRLAIFAKDAPGGRVLGTVNFTQFVRGPGQYCNLGYGLDHRDEGRGLMQEALETAIPFVFGRLAMHRIAANHLPENDRSARLLDRLGFVKEGFARQYLYIDGAWRDHVLTALTNHALTSPGVRSSA